jgi:hypothetical protein
MKKSWAIGLLSIFPGLGFMVLGKIRQGYIVAIITVSSVILGFLTLPLENLSITLFTLALIAWVSQGYYAILLSQSQARSKAGLDLPVRQVSIAPPAQDASLGEKHLHKARQTVMELLQSNETLKIAIEGRTGTTSLIRLLLMGPSLNIRVVYLGITEQHLIFVNMDRLGKPSVLQRIPFSQVAWAKSKEGLLSDWIDIQVGETNPLKIEVPRSSRETTHQLLAILSK